MKRLVVAVDCDDVLIDSTSYMIDKYNSIYGTKVLIENSHKPNNNEWNTADDNQTLERFKQIQTSSDYGLIAPTQSTIDAIAVLSKSHELHLVTARPSAVVNDIMRHGNGSRHQRNAYAARNELHDVVEAALHVTHDPTHDVGIPGAILAESWDLADDENIALDLSARDIGATQALNF